MGSANDQVLHPTPSFSSDLGVGDSKRLVDRALTMK